MLEIVLRDARRPRRRRRPHHHRDSACTAGCTTGRSSGWSATRSGTTTGRIASTTTTAAIPTAWSCSARRAHGELVEINRRAAESDLVDLREPQLRADERRPQVDGGRAVRLRVASRRTTRRRRSSSRTRSWIRRESYLAHSVRAPGRRSSRSTLKVFHIETVLNNRMFDGPLSFLTKNEDDFTETDRLKFQAMKWTLDKLPFAARREIFMRTPAAYELIALLRRRERAGARQDARASRTSSTASTSTGQADILIMRHPVHLAVQRQLEGAQPAARAGDGARLLLSHVPAASRSCAKGGVLILTHPC